jgi:LVIVD repeat-containing protein
VQNIPYAQRFADQPSNYGTDIEFATVRGARHALAGSHYNGLHIVDIRRPDRPKLVGRYDCGILQGDVQAFRAADGTGRTLATYTADAASRKTDTACFRDATALGFEPIAADGRGKQGTFIVDISNPAAPRTVSFVELPQGSHNLTVHPSITGANELSPKKVGYWNISDELGPTHDPEGTCTAHVFDVHESAQLMTIAFYNGGVRVVDLSGLATGGGLKAISNIARGLDVYRFDGSKPPSPAPGHLDSGSPGRRARQLAAGRRADRAEPGWLPHELPDRLGLGRVPRIAGVLTTSPAARRRCPAGA